MEDKKFVDIDPVMTAFGLIVSLKTKKYERPDVDILRLLSDLKKQFDLVQSGDLSNIEAMLYSQAFSLNLMFSKLAVKVENAENPEDVQLYIDLAMRTQNNSRKTLLALCEIKHPKRATFIKQQNCAVNQQVNNASTARIPKNSNAENELLEVKHDLELRTTITPVQVDSQLETVGEINRGKNTRGENHKQDECL